MSSHVNSVMLPQPFLPTDLCKSLFLATAPGHFTGGAVKHARPCPGFEPYLHLMKACTTQLDQPDNTEKGLFFNCIQLCSDTADGEEATKKPQQHRLETMMHFTTNQLSLTAFVAVAFKQLFLHLVKDQLSIKTSVRWFAEDSSQPPVTKAIKLVSPVCHCDSHPLFQMGKP